MNFDLVGGRKFVLAIISLIAGIATHIMSAKGLSTEVVGLIIGVIGAFSVANTVTTVKAPFESAKTSPIESVVEPARLGVDYSEQLAAQQALLEQIAITVSNTQQMLVNAMQAGSQPK